MVLSFFKCCFKMGITGLSCVFLMFIFNVCLSALELTARITVLYKFIYYYYIINKTMQPLTSANCNIKCNDKVCSVCV